MRERQKMREGGGGEGEKENREKKNGREGERKVGIAVMVNLRTCTASQFFRLII